MKPTHFLKKLLLKTRYSGEYLDKETGYIYLRARYYDPVTSRMLSEDSYTGEINDPLSLDLYTYCGNEPVNNVDPSGHDAILLTEALSINGRFSIAGLDVNIDIRVTSSHTALMIQDSKQNWHWFEWGGTVKSALNSEAKVFFEFIKYSERKNFLLNKKINYTQLKVYLQNNDIHYITTDKRAFDNFHYIVGDFSNAISSMRYLKNNISKYNFSLINQGGRNCAFVALEMLQKGNITSEQYNKLDNLMYINKPITIEVKVLGITLYTYTFTKKFKQITIPEVIKDKIKGIF